MAQGKLYAVLGILGRGQSSCGHQKILKEARILAEHPLITLCGLI